MSVELILILAISSLVGLLVCFTRKAIINYLKGYIKNIAQQISAARILKNNADDMINELQQQLHDCQQEMEESIAETKKQAEALVKNNEQEVEELIKLKTQMAIERIGSFEQTTINEIRSHSVELAIATVKAVINEKITSEKAKKIIEKITNEYKNLH